MTSATAKTMTARALFDIVKPFGPTVVDGGLTFATDLPEELIPFLSAMHTGVRALLTHRRWWGSTSADGTRPRVITLDPSAVIPDGITMLAVEGDARWDCPPTGKASPRHSG